jgi:glycosyltransferase involved in cell wall biosynthesis
LKFSIITITKNNKSGLSATLKSIVSQSCRDFELIVIDGHSTDGTSQVVQEHKSIITRFEQDAGKGIYAAMNQGLSLANGEWVLFLNGGDTFASPEVLQQAYGQLIQEADFIHGRAFKETGEEKHPFRGFKNPWIEMPFCHQAVFNRRSTILQRAYSLRFKIAGDHEFYLYWIKRKASFKRIDLDIALSESGGISEAKLMKRVWECYCASCLHYFPVFSMHRYYLAKLLWAYRKSKASS